MTDKKQEEKRVGMPSESSAKARETIAGLWLGLLTVLVMITIWLIFGVTL